MKTTLPAEPTVRIPVVATYRVTNGEAVLIDAEYADIPADEIARLLLRGFGIPIHAAEAD